MASRTRAANKTSAIVLCLLVPTLLFCAFVLSVVGTAGKSWSWRVEKAFEGNECMGINHRGPFQYCNIALRADAPNISSTSTTTDESTEPTPTETTDSTSTDESSESSTPSVTACPNADSIARWEEICVRATNPGGACSVKPKQYATSLGRDSTGDSSIFCQQLRISGSLLIAGCALIGIGMLASFVLAGISLLQLFGRYKAPDDTSSPSIGAVSLFTSVVSGLGFLAMLFGTILAANNLVNLQYPSGDWRTTGDDANIGIIGPWLIGNSVAIATAGWVMAAVGASLVSKVWPGPTAYYQRVGQNSVHGQTVIDAAKHDRRE
ncbi:hypothetical protein Slin15195_G064110 [Septoria linicola]|uniref:Uncharacterized protein n=1 Tax=Septoria linicola TaxID=215465 RepID=A0A9Q9AP40_9PEZI|nr:hypothetical protein Slin14017_G114430 [Septoria linicola]USW53092.1 hypothetical protein Slin15195_G064110 [Septoria linicola]